MSPIDDKRPVLVQRTETFARWLSSLRDRQAALRISARIDRLEAGHWGDAKAVGGGVSELRVHFGPGYRLYAARRGQTWVVLLCGGDKDSQARDIVEAQRIWKAIADEA